MRKIITTTFLTLDGVMQAPGGPQEDTSGGFKYGGWSYGYMDEVGGGVMNGFMQLPFALLLGKFTYDIFAGYWPTATIDSAVANPFNANKKYVVTSTPFEPTWNNTEVITGDVVAQIKKLKEMDGPDLWVHGSGNLIQTLLKNHLIDRMHIWYVPVTVGGGKRLFAEGTQPSAWKLIESKITPVGVIIATYEPNGDIKTGTIGE